MWYFIIGFITIIYILINLYLPGAVNTIIATYVIQPLLWISLVVLTFLLARHEGINIYHFKKERRWNLGKTPAHAGLLIGCFQVSLLIIAGLFGGFGRSPFSYSPTSITITIFFVGSFLIGTEISRAYLIKTGANTRKYLTIVLIFTTLLYMILHFSINDFFVLDFVAYRPKFLL